MESTADGQLPLQPFPELCAVSSSVGCVTSQQGLQSHCIDVFGLLIIFESGTVMKQSLFRDILCASSALTALVGNHLIVLHSSRTHS
jgi:hypothetical protein